jgi:hypothetical protein
MDDGMMDFEKIASLGKLVQSMKHTLQQRRLRFGYLYVSAISILPCHGYIQYTSTFIVRSEHETEGNQLSLVGFLSFHQYSLKRIDISSSEIIITSICLHLHWDNLVGWVYRLRAQLQPDMNHFGQQVKEWSLQNLEPTSPNELVTGR